MRPDTKYEWLETNGLGGDAFGTSTGLPTRRYHGVLISARKPPVDRRLLFAGVQASLIVDGRAVPLHAKNFKRHPFPEIVYRPGSLTRATFMRYGHNTTVIQFRLKTKSKPVRLSVRILPAFRDHHAIDLDVQPQTRGISARKEGSHLIRFSRGEEVAFVHHSSGHFFPDAQVVGPFRYLWETRQGMEDTESFYSPGHILADLTPQRGLDLIFSDRPIVSPNPEAWRKSEEIRRRRLVSKARGQIEKNLFLAADQFIVSRAPGRKRTIVAGYPWFTDWGRDTMISLEGLTLVRGEFKAAEEILSAFAGAESQGMIPNHYPDADAEPHFNTVDASLWFFEAGRKFLDRSGRISFVRRVLFPVFRSIILHHIAGARFNIRADRQTGLLFSGEEGTQLTWMDAKVDDWVVTPRHGYPVEIQALWYNALNIFSDLCGKFRMRDRLLEESERLADLCGRTFLKQYWYEKGGYLHDCIRPDGIPVPDLRPNQLLAMSLTYPILTDLTRGKQILSAVRKKLLTPYGLRTLSPDHPDYKGRHEGSRVHRDAAYHQGTVWPWLLGPYARACLHVEGNTQKTKTHLRRLLAGFEKHLQECAVGTVSEILDGNSPHEPKGCVAQAWSVAELLAISGRVRR